MARVGQQRNRKKMKLTVKQKFCASSWLINETNILSLMSSDVILKTHSLNNYNLRHFVKETRQCRMQPCI